ncbi:MAG: class I SAM-dependent methyltransferase [Alphaproteobacteria bacterium]|nr:class I SAM-dependent methyltransferase [Alphaproteobacteria bacterium]MBU2082548.1 class I SAM-dependent methyltransferase [Alphaproteobacteria bacterium]MBU2142812.1 class I SAM-dependent methyltransferase [Alphaproteobacteria bacterium]MBU2195234.1 class I SAM-dependent methyltransferase [Alphaproteobacteria bacterium]
MSQLDPTLMFDKARAAQYDSQFARANAFRDVIHLVTDLAFASLPNDARILVVGAGTGSEIIALAARHSSWHFTAVDPAGAMLEVFREKAIAAGILDRCTIHVGYIETLADLPLHDAATSLLVSHFLQTDASRGAFFAEIAARLKPGALLVNADLAADMTEKISARLYATWEQMLRETGADAAGLDNYRAGFGKDFAVHTPAAVEALIENNGFERPSPVLQTLLMRTWLTAKT